jgi:hypothetical protein
MGLNETEGSYTIQSNTDEVDLLSNLNLLFVSSREAASAAVDAFSS